MPILTWKTNEGNFVIEWLIVGQMGQPGNLELVLGKDLMRIRGAIPGECCMKQVASSLIAPINNEANP